jgi:hypothetical protein
LISNSAYFCWELQFFACVPGDVDAHIFAEICVVVMSCSCS